MFHFSCNRRLGTCLYSWLWPMCPFEKNISISFGYSSPQLWIFWGPGPPKHCHTAKHWLCPDKQKSQKWVLTLVCGPFLNVLLLLIIAQINLPRDKDAARPKSGGHEFGVTQRSVPVTSQQNVHFHHPQPSMGDKTSQTNRQIWRMTGCLWCFVTYCWSSAPWRCYLMVKLIKNVLLLRCYCLIHDFTAFWTTLETRGTRSCIRVHGSGVLARDP